MAATALAAPLHGKVARGQLRFAADPFALGIASAIRLPTASCSGPASRLIP